MSHRPVLAAEEPEHRLRHDIAALLDPMKPRHPSVLADTGQFPCDRMDRPALDRRRGREPGRQPRRHPGFRDADFAGLRIQEQRRREGQQRQRRTRIVPRRDLLPAALADLPGERAAPRLRPRKRHATDVVGPRAPGLDDPADQPDQFVPVRPLVATRPDVPLVIAEPTEKRGVYRSQELALCRRRSLAILPEIPADRAVLLQIGAVGIDAHAARGVAVDDVEQMVPAELWPTGREGGRSRRGRPGPVVQPAAHVPGHALVGAPGGAVGRFRRNMPSGQQHGGRVLAVVADRAGAMPLDRNEPVAAAGFVSGHDRIGFGLAARNLAVEPAVRTELDRTHHAAPEIVQPPHDKTLSPTACSMSYDREGRQAALSAFLAPKPRPGHPPSQAGAPTGSALSGIATDPAPPARGAQAPSRARHAARASRVGWMTGSDPRPTAAPNPQKA